MIWLWSLPLLTTLIACVVLFRATRALTATAIELQHRAQRLEPLAREIETASLTARAFGSTVADAARRYTPRHG